MHKIALAVATTLAAALTATAAHALTLTAIGTVKSGPFSDGDPRVAEINAYDPAGQRIYVVNPKDGLLDVIDASVPSMPVSVGQLDIVAACAAALGGACPLTAGAEPNSVAIQGKFLAVALGNAVRTDNGHAVFFELNGAQPPKFLAAVEVGALPDMITFSEDGRFALTANEGEPSQDYQIDPPGSVSVIELARLGKPGAVRHAGFERFDNRGQRAKLEREGVRIFGPGASVSQDLEPEYIAVRGNKAYVTLQENNALAVINIAGATVEKIVGLGLKDYSLPGNALDPSDRDGGINIANWPVFGMYQPDGIHTVTTQGRTYLVTANEGDARDYAGYSEEARVGSGSYVLDPIVFPNAADLKNSAKLGRLTVTTASGDLDGDGDFDRIQAFGARSVSIRDQQGALVWDSGDMFEKLSAARDAALQADPTVPNGNLFNTTNSDNSRDNRSDDKGVEPESVVVGEVNGRPYAFVGLERDSGIVVLDLSEPTAPTFVTYANNRRFPAGKCSDVVDCGDLGPEGLTFVPAAQSPTSKALLIVSNEVSSTTTIWEIE